MRFTATGIFAFIAFVFVAHTGCSRYIKLDAQQSTMSNEANGKGVSLQVIWMKPKSDSVDMELMLRNNYETGIFISQTAWRMEIDGQVGMPRKFDMPIVLAAGEMGGGRVYFSFNKGYKGEKATIILDPIMTTGDKRKKVNPLRFELPLSN